MALITYKFKILRLRISHYMYMYKCMVLTLSTGYTQNIILYILRTYRIVGNSRGVKISQIWSKQIFVGLNFCGWI